MMKKVITWAIVIFIAFYLLTQPHGAANCRFKKARFMTDPSMTPEPPTAAETAHFLRRFADLMSVGHNANYLHHAAVLLASNYHGRSPSGCALLRHVPAVYM